MTDAVLNHTNLEFKIAALLDGIKLPDFEKIITKMFERMPVPPAFNYIGDLNKTDALY